jgi:hypothetical protein
LADVVLRGYPLLTLHWQQVFISMVIYGLYNSAAEVCGIPHLPKPGRYGAPVIRYGTGREKFRLASSMFQRLGRLLRGELLLGRMAAKRIMRAKYFQETSKLT